MCVVSAFWTEGGRRRSNTIHKREREGGTELIRNVFIIREKKKKGGRLTGMLNSNKDVEPVTDLRALEGGESAARNVYTT